MKIRTKCDWYKFGEKFMKFFLTLKKRQVTQNIAHKALSNEHEININIYQFYEHLYNRK